MACYKVYLRVKFTCHEAEDTEGRGVSPPTLNLGARRGCGSTVCTGGFAHLKDPVPVVHEDG